MGIRAEGSSFDSLSSINILLRDYFISGLSSRYKWTLYDSRKHK